MHFFAKLKLESNLDNAENNARALFDAFWDRETYNPKNSISIKGQDAELQIHFEEFPSDSIKAAVRRCEISYFQFGETNQTNDETENIRTKSGTDLTENDCAQESSTIEDGTSDKFPKHAVQKEYHRSVKKNIDSLTECKARIPKLRMSPGVKPGSNTSSEAQDGKAESNIQDCIPELTQMAQKANSYTEFLTYVMDWLEIGKQENNEELWKQRREAFLSIENAIANGCVDWKRIAENAVYNTRDKNVLWSAVSKKMKECGHKVHFLNFMQILVLYRNFKFPKDTNIVMADSKTITNDINSESYMQRIPELTELANNSSSYEELLSKVCEWLGITRVNIGISWEQRKMAFLSIEEVASKFHSRITWKNLQVNGAKFNLGDRNILSELVTIKMQEIGITHIQFMKFLSILIKYRNFDFLSSVVEDSKNEEIHILKDSDTLKDDLTHISEKTTTSLESRSDEESEDCENKENTLESQKLLLHSEDDISDANDLSKKAINSQSEETFLQDSEEPKCKVKMACMPEIPWFEELLAGIDKTQPIEERIKSILTAMGIEESKYKERKNLIYKVANVAVRESNLDETVFNKAGLEVKQILIARMSFYELVNDFVRNYESKTLKLIDFLRDLKKVVI